jgi:cytochrome c oxidase subunit 3
MPNSGFKESAQLAGAGRGAARVPQRAYVTGMTVALGGILMFFMALASACIVRQGFPQSGGQPLEATRSLLRILTLDTLILLASSVTLVRARSRLLAEDGAEFRHWWGVTAILGVLFLAGQLIAWRQLAGAGVYPATSPGSSFFYVFTAAHGLYLLGGVVALLAVAFRPPRLLTRATAVEVVGMYWHFMDAIWLLLYLFFLTGNRT